MYVSFKVVLQAKIQRKCSSVCIYCNVYHPFIHVGNSKVLGPGHSKPSLIMLTKLTGGLVTYKQIGR